MTKKRVYRYAGTALIMFCLAFLLIADPAIAQTNYPNKPIKLITGREPGGNTDIGYRLLAEIASKTLGQPVVVENKIGGNSYLAFTTVMNAKPDGYTIGDYSTMTYDLSTMYEKTPRKIEDATTIGCYYSVVHAVAVKADAPWKTFKDVVEYARKNPGQFTYAVPMAGAPPHFAMILVGKKEKVDWKVVPYKGLASAVPALLGGHIMSIAGLAGTHLEQVKAGNMKLLAVTGAARLPDFPDVPTLRDLKYDIDASFDIGLVAPKGLPPQILAKLEDAFMKAAKDPKFQKFLKENNLPSTVMNSNEYTQYLKKAYELRVPLIRELGLAYK
jgi:tripartite-type tricarboxylate transporter receptor subunit TctC